MSPIGPSVSTRMPKGCSDEIGQRLMHDTNSVFEYLSGFAIKSCGACSVAGRVSATLRTRQRTNGHQRDALVGRSEPDDLGRLVEVVAAAARVAAVALTALVVLLLLRRRRGGAEDAEESAEELSGRALDDSDDVTRVLGLLLVRDLLLLEEQQALALDLDVVLLLVELAQVSRGAEVARAVLLLFALLLLLVLLRAPHLVHIEELDRHDVALERTVAVLGACVTSARRRAKEQRTADVDVGVGRLRRDVRIAAVLLVDA